MGVLRTPGKSKPSATSPEASYGPLTQTIPFSVLREDIAAAGPRATEWSRYTCPTARAIKRLVGRGVSIGWGYGSIYWVDGARGVAYTLKDNGRVKRWDNSGSMEPWEGVLVKDG